MKLKFICHNRFANTHILSEETYVIQKPLTLNYLITSRMLEQLISWQSTPFRAQESLLFSQHPVSYIVLPTKWASCNTQLLTYGLGYIHVFVKLRGLLLAYYGV